MLKLINEVCSFFPAYCCMIALVVLIFFGIKTKLHRIMLAMITIGTIEYFIAGFYNLPLSDSEMMRKLLIISQSTTFLIFPFIYEYVNELINKRGRWYWYAFWIIPSVVTIVFASKGRILYSAYYALCGLGILLCEIHVVIILYKNGFKPVQIKEFLKQGREASFINSSCLTLLIIMTLIILRILLMKCHHIPLQLLADAVNILLGISLITLFYISIFFSEKKFTRKIIRNPYLAVNPDTYHNGREIAVKRASLNNELTDNIRKYIETERHFLDNGINITSVARALGTNRTYLATALHDDIKMSFRQYINSLRITEAKRLMKESPDEILDIIATKCGFSGDSQFVKKFMEIEGISPRNWLKNS